MKPTVGRIVHVLVDPSTNNGAEIAPAIITRVWGDKNSYGGYTVNYRVIVDQLPEYDRWCTSALLFDDSHAAEAYIEKRSLQPDGLVNVAVRTAQKHSGMVAFWPPRA